jgi:SAM-dependent methyltransferase
MRNYQFLRENLPLWTDLIQCKEYVGIDLMAGPSVDIIMNSHKLSFPDDTFDLVMSLNVLEHDSDPQVTISEGARVMKPGGTFLIACPVETFLEHKELGDGDCETYNFITSEKLTEWIDKTGLKVNKTIRTEIGHLVNATK